MMISFTASSGALPCLFLTVLVIIQLLTGEIISAEPSSKLLEPSPDLTSEELAILEELKDFNIDNSNLSPLNDSLETLQTELKGLQSISQSISSLKDSSNESSALFNELGRRTLEIVSSKVFQKIDLSQLKEAQDAILDAISSTSASGTDSSSDVEEENDDSDHESTEPSVPITLDEMKETLDWSKLVEPSEQLAAVHLSNLLQKEWKATVKGHEKKYERKIKELETELELKLKEARNSAQTSTVKEECVDTIEAANMVQSSLWLLQEDGGRYDHMVNAKVVHGPRWTSNTFEMSANSSRGKVTISNVPWRKYIPEDWERILPSGWEELDVSFLQNLPKKLIPSYFISHLPKALTKDFLWKFAPPPEAVQNPNTNLGSCWPMSGTSGKITFRFDYPIAVDTVVLHHHPGTLSKNDKMSAPRNFQLKGYPPCKDDGINKECKVVGFDQEKAIDFGSFEYKIVPSLSNFDSDEVDDNSQPGRSIQTFSIGPKPQESSSVNEAITEHDQSNFDAGFAPPEGSCNAAASCSAPPDEDYEVSSDGKAKIVEAITINVENNWGNPNYTCLYRVQIFGERI